MAKNLFKIQMKKIFNIVILFLMISGALSAQHTIGPSGKDISTSGGAISYSVGQLVYTSSTGTGSLRQGIQQNLEVFTIGTPLMTSLNLKMVTYPNPTTDYLILELTDKTLTNLNYSLFDINGKVISNSKITEDVTRIQMQALSLGVYILNVSQLNKELKSFKIIKK
jgi:predicted small secreted protein